VCEFHEFTQVYRAGDKWLTETSNSYGAVTVPLDAEIVEPGVSRWTGYDCGTEEACPCCMSAHRCMQQCTYHVREDGAHRLVVVHEYGSEDSERSEAT
jgi:hypothetical protein